MELSEESLKDVMQVASVTGACLTDGMGEVVESSVGDESMEELIAFVAGMTPSLAELLGTDTIEQVLLHGDKDDHLAVFLQEEHVLGVCTERKGSILTVPEKLKTALGEG